MDDTLEHRKLYKVVGGEAKRIIDETLAAREAQRAAFTALKDELGAATLVMRRETLVGLTFPDGPVDPERWKPMLWPENGYKPTARDLNQRFDEVNRLCDWDQAIRKLFVGGDTRLLRDVGREQRLVGPSLRECEGAFYATLPLAREGETQAGPVDGLQEIGIQEYLTGVGRMPVVEGA